MKVLSSALLAVAFALLLWAPAGADGDGAITKTFELTLFGDAPAGDTFTVSYVVSTPEGGEGGETLTFCGGTPGSCIGSSAGTVYTRTATFNLGSPIEVDHVYRRNDVSFAEGTEILTADKTNSESFDFGSAAGMPDTGAGAMAGSGLPAAIPMSALALLAGAGYAALRRR